MGSKTNHPGCLLAGHCNPLRARLDCKVVGVVLGDDGMLDAELEGASPLMISWIDASSASTRCDICITARIKKLYTIMKRCAIGKGERATHCDR